MRSFEEELAALRAAGLLRRPRVVERFDGRTAVVEGREVLSFASNNYLALAGDERLREASARAARDLGAGAASSRAVAGTLPLHEALEAALARFEGREAAVLFPTGYAAGLGLVSALAGAGDLVALDRLDHACLVDGARLAASAGATLLRYPHADAAAAARMLDRALAGGASGRRVLLVTDGVFSMDGDLAPLPALGAIARERGALLLDDEAHGTGVLGSRGRGAAEALSAEDEVAATMGTLSKALGGLGGFVAGPRDLVECLRQKARSFLYTTAAPPAVLAAALAALEIVGGEEGRQRREALARIARSLRARLTAAGLEAPAGETPIVPVVLGEAASATRASASLLEKGLLVPAIRPPTVPEGTSRLRVSLTAAHTEEDLERLVRALGEVVPRRR